MAGILASRRLDGTDQVSLWIFLTRETTELAAVPGRSLVKTRPTDLEIWDALFNIRLVAASSFFVNAEQRRDKSLRSVARKSCEMFPGFLLVVASLVFRVFTISVGPVYSE